MLALNRSVIAGLLLSLATVIPTVNANEHAVSVTIRSVDEVKELALQFPTRLTAELQNSLQAIAGPLLSVADNDSPVMIYLDWQGDLPEPIVCMKNYRREALAALKTLSQAESVTLPSGVIKIEAAAPIYLKEELEWLIISTREESAQKTQPPVPSAAAEHLAPLHAEIQLQKIPTATRLEIAKVLARRVLPIEIATVDEFSAEQLVQLYTKRLIDSLANQAETLEVAARATASGPELSIKANGQQLRPVSVSESKLPLTHMTPDVAFVSLHTSLSDEEVAYMTWWAQQLPERTIASFKEANIEDRSGEAGLQQLAQAGAGLLRRIAQSGTIEGFLALTGENHELPVFGFAVPDTASVRTQLEQLARDPALKELGLMAAEFDVRQSDQFALHRFTFGGVQDEPLPLWIATSKTAVYLLVDSKSVDDLKAWLPDAGEPMPSATPLQLNWPGFSLAGYLGLGNDQNSAQGTLQLIGSYTETGLQLRIQLPAHSN